MTTNPFCTRRVRPGAVPFLCPEGVTLADMVERLQKHQWRGQIIGPHGTGKSTLLASLVPHLQSTGREVIAMVRHGGERSLPRDFWQAVRQATSNSIVIIDGYEQLGVWSRVRLRYLTHRRKVGLLLTAHADMGLPTIHRTIITSELACRVVEHLLRDSASLVKESEVVAHLRAHNGNLREALFALYDLHERCPAPFSSGSQNRK